MGTGTLDRSTRVQVELSGARTAGAVMLGAGLLLTRPPATGLPCPFRSITGVPCPLCGMTRSVIATMHLHLHAALAVNPAGVLAVAVAVVLLFAWRLRRLAIPSWAPPVAVAFVWSLQLFRPLFT